MEVFKRKEISNSQGQGVITLNYKIKIKNRPFFRKLETDFAQTSMLTAK